MMAEISQGFHVLVTKRDARAKRLATAGGGRYLTAMATDSEIAHWTARVAELEAELDAATRLSEVNRIAGELHRTRAALKKAKAEHAPPRPRRGTSQPGVRRSASSAADSSGS
jgi:hypothetical protein